jgi:hypothetical protein
MSRTRAARQEARPVAPGRLLLVGGVPWIVDRLAGLAAAAGVELERVPRLTEGWSQRSGIALVLADPQAEIAPERRDGVVLICPAEPDPLVWQRAVELGAEQVAVLPEAEPWLLDRMLDAVTPADAAPVVAVIGGRGGAGASTLAVGLAGVAAGSGVATLLVDADPLGGGLDLLVGVEQEPGLRWADLAGARGRLQPGVLSGMLPAVDGLGVLSWGRSAGNAAAATAAATALDRWEPPGESAGESVGESIWPEPDAVAAVLRSAVREYALVVVDLSRRFGPGELVALRACRSVIVVVPAEVRAAAAATAVCRLLDPVVADQRLVVRGPAPSGLPAEAVADALGLPLAGELRSEPGVAAALDRGERLPDRPRGALTLLCRRLAAQVLAR